VLAITSNGVERMSGILRRFLCWLEEHPELEVVSRSDFGGPPDPDQDPGFWLAPDNFQTVRCTSCGRVFEMHRRDVPNEAHNAGANNPAGDIPYRVETNKGKKQYRADDPPSA
jgi:hypothetical protein